MEFECIFVRNKNKMLCRVSWWNPFLNLRKNVCWM